MQPTPPKSFRREARPPAARGLHNLPRREGAAGPLDGLRRAALPAAMLSAAGFLVGVTVAACAVAPTPAVAWAAGSSGAVLVLALVSAALVIVLNLEA